MRPSWGEPYRTLAARMLAAIATARDAARGHEAVLVSHQAPIWLARSALEGRHLWHDPRARECTLASLTTIVCAGDDVIEGHPVKAGDKVVILTYIAHHSPKYWEEPETFDPERFAPERAKKRVKYSYLPFAAGKRACIGGALSQIENTLALVQLLRRFTPEYAGPVPAKIHATVTLCPKGGLPFRIHELS